MAIAADIVVSREPVFTGKTGEFREPLASKAEALQYASELRDGTLDPFLRRAWTEIVVAQNRGPGGQFGTGWHVDVRYSRPGAGDDSGAENPDPGDAEGGQ